MNCIASLSRCDLDIADETARHTQSSFLCLMSFHTKFLAAGRICVNYHEISLVYNFGMLHHVNVFRNFLAKVSEFHYVCLLVCPLRLDQHELSFHMFTKMHCKSTTLRGNYVSIHAATVL